MSNVVTPSLPDNLGRRISQSSDQYQDYWSKKVKSEQVTGGRKSKEIRKKELLNSNQDEQN
jgi:hypothetical protein